MQSSHRQKQLHKNDAAIIQREREIEDIAQGIIDLSDLFRDLQTMVIDQGTMLDRIDYNVERMATDVQAADKELNVASGYQKRTTKRKIIFLLLLIVIGVFILLLIKPKHHGGADNGVSGGGGSPAEPVNAEPANTEPASDEPVGAEDRILKIRDDLGARESFEAFSAETLKMARGTSNHPDYRPSRRGG